jgi:hypothetical protein
VKFAINLSFGDHQARSTFFKWWRFLGREPASAASREALAGKLGRQAR